MDFSSHGYREKFEAVAGAVMFLLHIPAEAALRNTNNFISKVACSGDIATTHTAGGEESSKPGYTLMLVRLDGWGGYGSHLSVFFLCLWVGRRLDFSWALTQEKEKTLSYLVLSPKCLLFLGT